jgi:hypothetical protein
VGAPFGNHIEVLHADGYTSRYAHLKKHSIRVGVGDFVECGEKLGEMGSSGNSLGPHLHYEVFDPDGSRHDTYEGPCSPEHTRWTHQGGYLDVPGTDCAPDLPACEPMAELTCGDRHETTNDGPGSTDQHVFYGCADWVYTGSEVVVSITTDRDEPVAVSLTGLTADLDMYALESASCMGRDCLVHSANSAAEDEWLTVDARAGVPLFLVVDGYKEAASPFRMEVACDGSWPLDPSDSAGQTGHTGVVVDTSGSAGDTAVPPGTSTTSTTSTGTHTGGVGQGSPAQRDSADPEPGGGSIRAVSPPGCGCAGLAHPGALPLLLVFWVRRRSRHTPDTSQTQCRG